MHFNDQYTGLCPFGFQFQRYAEKLYSPNALNTEVAYVALEEKKIMIRLPFWKNPPLTDRIWKSTDQLLI